MYGNITFDIVKNFVNDPATLKHSILGSIVTGHNIWLTVKPLSDDEYQISAVAVDSNKLTYGYEQRYQETLALILSDLETYLDASTELPIVRITQNSVSVVWDPCTPMPRCVPNGSHKMCYHPGNLAASIQILAGFRFEKPRGIMQAGFEWRTHGLSVIAKNGATRIYDPVTRTFSLTANKPPDERTWDEGGRTKLKQARKMIRTATVLRSRLGVYDGLELPTFRPGANLTIGDNDTRMAERRKIYADMVDNGVTGANSDALAVNMLEAGIPSYDWKLRWEMQRSGAYCAGDRHRIEKILAKMLNKDMEALKQMFGGVKYVEKT